MRDLKDSQTPRVFLWEWGWWQRKSYCQQSRVESPKEVSCNGVVLVVVAALPANVTVARGKRARLILITGRRLERHRGRGRRGRYLANVAAHLRRCWGGMQESEEVTTWNVAGTCCDMAERERRNDERND